METLLEAILGDDRSKVRELLKADPSLVSRRLEEARLYKSRIFHWMYVGDTALHLAAAGYRVEIVRLLLAAGADPNAAMNHRNSRPLHYAADGYITGPVWDPKEQVNTIRCLLEAGAAVNAQDKNGAASLHRAVRTRSADAARFLLESGADPRLRNKPGSTPFHLAVQNTGRGGSGENAAKDAQRRIIGEFLSSASALRSRMPMASPYWTGRGASGSEKCSQARLNDRALLTRTLEGPMTRNSVAFWLVALFGIGLIGVGATALVAPQTAAAIFGVPASSGSTPAYIWAAGTRDIALGCFALVLVGLRVNARVVGAFILIAALIPVGDVINVCVNAGSSSREALVLHGVSIVFLIALGALLWRSATAART